MTGPQRFLYSNLSTSLLQVQKLGSWWLQNCRTSTSTSSKTVILQTAEESINHNDLGTTNEKRRFQRTNLRQDSFPQSQLSIRTVG